jgi:hypothetical protein
VFCCSLRIDNTHTPKKKTMKYFVIGGFAYSGKTTLLSLLPECHRIDTSEYLDKQLYKIIPEFRSHTGAERDRIVPNFMISKRQAKIILAESLLVKTFGRYHGIVRPTVESRLKTPWAGEFWCSTINNEEFGLMRKAITEFDQDATYHVFNLQNSDGGHYNNVDDSRELLEGGVSVPWMPVADRVDYIRRCSKGESND